MARRDDIVAHLDELLDIGSREDYGPNGLQVTGRDEVELVVTGVSAHRELFDRAAAAGAQMVLCHHGLFWGHGPGPVAPPMKARLKALFDADMSLAAYHLPLDAHPEVGNNALICQTLGLRRGEPFGEHRGRSIGFVGHPDGGLSPGELVGRCTDAFGSEPLVFEGGPNRVETVGVVSGGGADTLTEAVSRGLDALLTGEPREHVMADAREAGIHFIAAGHYATETFGVRRLGELLEAELGIRHEFVDLPNPV